MFVGENVSFFPLASTYSIRPVMPLLPLHDDELRHHERDDEDHHHGGVHRLVPLVHLVQLLMVISGNIYVET